MIDRVHVVEIEVSCSAVCTAEEILQCSLKLVSNFSSMLLQGQKYRALSRKDGERFVWLVQPF